MADNEQNDQIDEVEDLPEGEGEEDKTDWQAEARKRDGIAKRYKTQAAKLKADLEEERKKSSALAGTNQNKPEPQKGFDYGQKAYLKSSGITPDEFSFVEEVMRSTGKSLDEVLDLKYFQAELKERRDEKASKDAIPSGSKRSTSSTRDDVDYWIAKGQLPPADQVELRRKVVNEKIKRERSKSQFSDNPVVK